MGCFLACFGYTKKRKRLKPAYVALPGNNRLGSYVPLDSVTIHVEDDPSDSREKPKQKQKQKSSVRVRKKVSFNLNVQTYEPINVGEDSESDRDNKGEDKEEGKAEVVGASKHNSISSQVGSYPQNYRYINVLDGYDDEDELLFDAYDRDDDDHEEDEYEDEYDEDDYDYDDGHLNSETSRALSTELNKGETNTNSQQSDSLDGKRPLEQARDRSQYVHSVLNPVENLTQWKAAKARALPPPRQSKENVAIQKEPLISFSPTINPSKPLLQEVSVNASLSNWLDLNASSVSSNG